MFTLFAFLLFLGLVLVATLAFKMLVAHHIDNDIIRIVAVGAFFVTASIGIAWGIISLVFNSIFSYPITSHPLNNGYYFTQEQYGFATTMSSGYKLTFYRPRTFLPDQEVGEVQLECAGREAIHATLVPTHTENFRLRIAADNQERLDTLLAFGRPFHFRRTFEDKTLDFSKRP